jgi:FixJ family two-component response regulator
VDDDEAVREALGNLIEVFDLECLMFTGTEGFFASYTPDLFGCVITDVKMPGLDGLDLQKRLHAIDPALPVIVITSYADATTQSRALDLGARAFLTKPVNDIVLLRCLRQALNLPDTPNCSSCDDLI